MRLGNPNDELQYASSCNQIFIAGKDDEFKKDAVNRQPRTRALTEPRKIKLTKPSLSELLFHLDRVLIAQDRTNIEGCDINEDADYEENKLQDNDDSSSEKDANQNNQPIYKS